MAGFHIISNKLKELYQMLTMGGDAELDLHDSLDPFTEGINFWYVYTSLGAASGKGLGFYYFFNCVP